MCRGARHARNAQWRLFSRLRLRIARRRSRVAHHRSLVLHREQFNNTLHYS
jgi:hypothetical protein